MSGHGFGHASRDIEVINALGIRSPAARVIVRTTAPRWLFDLTATMPHAFHRVETDTGVVQHDSLTHDIAETMRRAVSFYRGFDAAVEDEAAFLRGAKASLVVGDIPPLAFAAAARAGVRSYALGNFTWDWIYGGFTDHAGVGARLISTMRTAYAQAHEAWRLPMHGGFEPFAAVVDVPFVARQSHRAPEETRRALGLPLDRKIVLSSFGGYGLSTLPLGGLDCLTEYDLVVAEATLGDASQLAHRSIHTLVEGEMYSRGFRYEDLVRAADVVLTKPGFGIIAECLANDTALVYTSRDEFREYDVLVREMPAFLRCAFIDHGQLFSGRWLAALERARSAPAPATRPATNGAEVVASRIMNLLG